MAFERTLLEITCIEEQKISDYKTRFKQANRKPYYITVAVKSQMQNELTTDTERLRHVMLQNQRSG